MAYKKWTQQDFDTIILLTQKGLSARQVAEQLNCSENSIKHYKVKLGLSARKGTNTTDYTKYLPVLEAANISLLIPAGIKGQSTFRCNKCNQEWQARIWDVCNREQACQNCASKVSSKIGNKWLDLLGIELREYKVPGTNYAVDGYDPTTNTVYEFLGDFWHGNLAVFDPEMLHPKKQVTFEELFISTINRLTEIRDLGYTVKYIWETEYNNGEPMSTLP